MVQLIDQCRFAVRCVAGILSHKCLGSSVWVIGFVLTTVVGGRFLGLNFQSCILHLGMPTFFVQESMIKFAKGV